MKSYDKVSDIDLASWNDLVELHKQHLEDLEKESLNLIRTSLDKYKEYTPLIPISTGKDSMVTLYLVRQIVPDAKAIFNNTSLDCADTYRMVKNISNCEIMNPDKGFYQYVQSDNMIPTRFSRFCCRIFKTGVMVSRLDHNKKYLLFMGMRNDESATRSDYQDEWVNEPEWGKTQWQGILPIRKWTEFDIWLYAIWKKLVVNQKYKKGYARVGCNIACPFYTKTTWILDKYWYPKMYDRWREILKNDFIKQRKWLVMNCTLNEYLTQAWNGGTFRDDPTDEVVEEFAKYNNLDINIAKKYFNKYCCECGKRIKHKEVLAMNMKTHGRNTNKFYCKKCLMNELQWDFSEWDKHVESFKSSGCDLF